MASAADDFQPLTQVEARYHRSMSRPPREPPLYLRLPALALSLIVGGFLVLQAGVPGCGSNEDKPQAEPTPAPAPTPELPAAAVTRPTAPTTHKSADNLADPPNPNPTDNPAGKSNSAGITPPLPTQPNSPKGPHNGNAKPIDPPKPRFFPASKAMAPLIEAENLLPPKQAPTAAKTPKATPKTQHAQQTQHTQHTQLGQQAQQAANVPAAGH